MKAASIKEIKTALANTPPEEIAQLCLRLARFKKENKELLTYILFESADETAYVNAVKAELNELFGTVNTRQPYLAKKTLRKILRTAGRYSRYSDAAATEVDLLIYVAERIRELELKRNTALTNLYSALLKKIEKIIEGLHEDIQYDYQKLMKTLRE